MKQLICCKMFIDRVHGLSMLVPLDDNPNVFQKVKIIDCVHYELNEAVYNCNEVKAPKELDRFLIEAFAFNPDYYIPGKMYVNTISGVVAKLKSISSDVLVFENGYEGCINNIYDEGRRRFVCAIDQFDLWLQLGDNHINDAIPHKHTISKRKLLSGFNTDDYQVKTVPKFYFNDIKNNTVYAPTAISDNRKVISVEYCGHLKDQKYVINVDDIGKTLELNELIMTTAGLKMKKQKIDRIYSDNPLSLNFDIIGENKIVICRTRDDDRYITSRIFDAEEIRGAYCTGLSKELNEHSPIDFNDITEFYIIDTNIDYDVKKIARIVANKSY